MINYIGITCIAAQMLMIVKMVITGWDYWLHHNNIIIREGWKKSAKLQMVSEVRCLTLYPVAPDISDTSSSGNVLFNKKMSRKLVIKCLTPLPVRIYEVRTLFLFIFQVGFKPLLPSLQFWPKLTGKKNQIRGSDWGRPPLSLPPVRTKSEVFCCCFVNLS